MNPDLKKLTLFQIRLSLPLGERINMNDTDMQIQWEEGSGESLEIGYLNPHGQQCCGHCGVPGTDHGQYAYKTECTICGYVYGTNGSDMHERRCPECQKGAVGIKYWRIPKS